MWVLLLLFAVGTQPSEQQHELLRRASLALDQQQFSTAVSLFERVLTNPLPAATAARVYANLAVGLMNLQDRPAALEA